MLPQLKVIPLYNIINLIPKYRFISVEIIKWGNYTVGSNIKIISEKTSREINPDYYFILAWHFLEEFIKGIKIFNEWWKVYGIYASANH